MSEQLIKILIESLSSILMVVITYLATVVINYFKQKREMLINQMGKDQYNMYYDIAKSIFYAVEQQYRFMPDAGKEKAMLFDKKLIEKIPGLKQEDIEHLREAVVGEINMQLQQSQILEKAPIFNPEFELSDPAAINIK